MLIFFTLMQVLWFFAPAMAANIAPVLASRYNWLPSLNQPIDGGATWRGGPLFGANKTIRGFVIGIIYGLIAAFLQAFLYQYFPNIREISLLDYGDLVLTAQLGTLLALGALMGDAAKSFLKRRGQRAPGQSWIPFDQIDFVVGAIVAAWWLVRLNFQQIVLAIIFIGAGSFLTSAIGRMLKIKKSL